MPLLPRPRFFCHLVTASAKSSVVGACFVSSVFASSSSYRYQPRCCLPPKVQPSSSLSTWFCAAAAEVDVAGLDLVVLVKTVGFTGAFGFRDWPGLAPGTKPTALAPAASAVIITRR